MELPLFKIRASSASEILAGELGLTEAQTLKYHELNNRKNDLKGKPLTPNMVAELALLQYKKDNPQLPEGVKTYCKQWVKEQLYDRRKNFTNKYLEKGLQVEKDSINFAGEHLGWVDAEKNDEWFEDDYMCGTPDVLIESTKVVIDVKNAYDCFTMPLFEDVIPTKGYNDQLQVYLVLTGYEKALLVYTLMDAPLDIMKSEMKRLSWKEGLMGEVPPEMYQRVKEQMSYSDLDPSLRLKTFEVEKDASVISKLVERVIMCREYIKTLKIK